MTKIVFIFVVFYTNIWADLGLEEGLLADIDTIQLIGIELMRVP